MENKHAAISLDNPIFSDRLRSFKELPDEIVPKPAKVLRVTKPVYMQMSAPKQIEKPQEPMTKFKPSPIQFYFDDIDAALPRKNQSAFHRRRAHHVVSSSLTIVAILLVSISAYIAIFGYHLHRAF